MSPAAQQPRVVAELGRPETPAESAARKAENSRLYRARKTVNNLVFSLLVSVGLAIVIVIAVPQASTTTLTSVDYATVASQAQVGITQRLVVPELGDGWSSNAAELRTTGTVSSWYIGLLTPGKGYIGVEQGLDANETWQSNRLESSLPTGSTTIDGVAWTVYDNRESGRDVGNVEYALATTAGGSTYLLYGTADPSEIETVAQAIGPQLGETE
jgi:hypothetical protein